MNAHANGLLKLIAGLGLAALLGACTVDSDTALLPASEGQAPFPAQAFLLSSNESYVLQGNGSSYTFVENETYSSGIFVPLGPEAPGFHVAQVLKSDGGYTYALIEANGSSAKRYSFTAATYADELGIAYTSVEGGIKITRRDDLMALYRAAHADLAELSPTSLRVFDAQNPAEAAAANQYLEELMAEADRKAAENGTSQPEAPPAQAAGNWRYQEEIDPMDDTRKQYIFGTPASASGTQDQPFIRIGCYENGMGITLYWGSVLSDMYPDGDLDFVNVAVRFNNSPMQQLGWVPSDDWASTYPPAELSGTMQQLGNGLMEAILPGLVPQINSTWSPKQFHTNMLAANTLTMRANTRGAGAATLSFDMAGYAEVARSFRSSCR